MNYNDLQIKHVPLGNEQPYFHQPFERIPRYPMPGDMIMLGAVVTPMDAGETVSLFWRTWQSDSFNEKAAFCIGTSDSVGNSGGDRYWMASIPSIGNDETLEYFFRVSSGKETVETEMFTYTSGTSDGFTCIDEYFPCEDAVIVKLHSPMTQKVRYVTVRAEEDHIMTEIFIGEDVPAGVGRYGMLVDHIPREVRIPGSRASLKIEINYLHLILAPDAEPVSLLGGFGIRSILVGDSVSASMSFFIDMEPEEKFFGFGERYNRLDQRGEVLRNLVFEQYKNQKLKTYLPVPFFQSSRGYGLSIDTDRDVSFGLNGYRLEIAAELGSKKSVTLRWYTGTPLEIASSYAKKQLSGLEVPEWALGPWMSSNEWNSQSRVLSEVKTGNDLDIPASVVVIEAWSDEATFYIWNDAEYRPKAPDEPMLLSDFTFPEDGLWPDPKGMIDALHADGKRLILWQIPVVKQFNEDPEATPEQQRLDQEYIEEAGLCLREEDGSAYRVRPGWFSNSRMPDLASSKAREWWFSKRSYLMAEMGVDGFKTDGGEHIWGRTVQSSKAYVEEFGSGVTGDTLINSFPMDYIASYHEAMKQHVPDGTALTFSRSGYTGAGGYPCHWTGDQGSTWDAYRGVINAVLNANISGIPMIGWDIGGFSGEIPTAELYLRSTAAAVFSPIMQYHSEFYNHVEPHVDRTPWNIAKRCDAPEVVDIYRMFAKLRMALIPYISGEIAHVRTTGEPLMRPLWMDSPKDQRAWEIEDEYRFGRALLIAPILNEGEHEREIYLPEGSWEEVWTGERTAGGTSIRKEVPLSTIAVFRDLDAPWPLPGDLFKQARKEL